MATNAERQAAFKAKMRQAGKKQITIWVDPAQQAAITALLAGIEKLLVTMPRPKVDPPRKLKKKRDTREVWQIKNDAVWEAHRTEITQQYAAGHKPSVIAAWLNTLGFVGSGATLNGYIKRF
ncbi:MAG: hypothetical protein H0U72_06485 [Nitrosospira sp.]|nr:hypothetical protein [Nitrosospira sp.]